MDTFDNEGPGFDEFYEGFKHIFTRTYCEDTVDYIYDLSVSSNYTQRYGLSDWTEMNALQI